VSWVQALLEWLRNRRTIPELAMNPMGVFAEVPLSALPVVADRAVAPRPTDPRTRLKRVPFLAVRSPLATASALLRHILEVVFVGSEEEMCGIGAGRIIAPVAHFHAGGYRPVMNLPRDAMREDLRTSSSVRAADLRVTEGRLTTPAISAPSPAPIRNDHPRPVPLSDRLLSMVENALRHRAKYTPNQGLNQ
jgi:hypothetical protein